MLIILFKIIKLLLHSALIRGVYYLTKYRLQVCDKILISTPKSSRKEVGKLVGFEWVFVLVFLVYMP